MEILVIACAVMKNELESVKTADINFQFLELGGLHDRPSAMAQTLQEKIKNADRKVDYVVLGYGLCGNGIVGVKAEEQPLVIPKADDCFTLFLGSLKARRKEHNKAPGTYYLTKGYIDEAKSPLLMFEEYTKRYDRETAGWLIQELYKNYTRLVLLDMGISDLTSYRKHAQDNASFLGVSYEEIKGSLGFFEKMVQGKWNTGEFFVLQPGEEVTQEMFLALD